MGFSSPDRGCLSGVGGLDTVQTSSELPLHDLLSPPFPAGPSHWDLVAGQ